MKIRPVGAELLHADGRTDMMRQIVFFFRSFLNSFPLKAQFLSKQILHLSHMAAMY